MEVCDLCTINEPEHTCKCCVHSYNPSKFVVCSSCSEDPRWKSVISEHDWDDIK